jgi:dUTP pyrophosphatase
MSLYIYVPDENLRADMRAHLFNKHRKTDSGFDLLCPEMSLDFSMSALAAEMRLGIVVGARTYLDEPAPYLLMARSSMSLTPLRMSNQIGLADAGYRGELIARVDYFGSEDEYEIEHGRRLFQIVQHNWLPWKKIYICDRLEDLPPAEDNRGDGGFGSTGR